MSCAVHECDCWNKIRICWSTKVRECSCWKWYEKVYNEKPTLIEIDHDEAQEILSRKQKKIYSL